MNQVPKVFISYAWESQEHQDKVLGLADWLESNGVEVIFDQYDPNPNITWPQWMVEGVQTSDFVVCVCTTAYRRRVENKEGASTGLGLQWEGRLIYDSIASKQQPVGKFQVVQFDEEAIDLIPTGLVGHNRYVIKKFELEDHGLENLYRIVTDQPRVTRPTRGQLRILDPLERAVVPRSGSETTGARIEIQAQMLRPANPVHLSIEASKRRILPKGGKGSFLVRASMMAMDFAWAAHRSEDFREAISLGLKALELDHQNRHCAELLSSAYFYLHDYSQASQWLNVAISDDPSDIDPQLKLLLAEHYLGRTGDPTQSAIAIFEHSSKDARDIEQFAGFYSDMGRYDEAIAVLQAVPEEHKTTRVKSQLAVYYWFKNRAGDAVEILESLPKAEFGATDWINLGVGRAELNRFGLAIEAINEGLKLRRTYQFASYALAQIYALMGEEETSVAKLRELLAVDSIYMERVEQERTFSSIRETTVFQGFLTELHSRPIGEQ